MSRCPADRIFSRELEGSLSDFMEVMYVGVDRTSSAWSDVFIRRSSLVFESLVFGPPAGGDRHRLRGPASVARAVAASLEWPGIPSSPDSMPKILLRLAAAFVASLGLAAQA